MGGMTLFRLKKASGGPMGTGQKEPTGASRLSRRLKLVLHAGEISIFDLQRPDQMLFGGLHQAILLLKTWLVHRSAQEPLLDGS